MARPPAELLDPAAYPYAMEIATRFADVDTQGHINNVAMATIMEDARVRFDLMSGLRAAYDHARLVVAAVHVDYLAESYYPAPFHIHAGVIEVGGSSWTLGMIARQADGVKAFSRVVQVFIDGDRPARLTDRLRATVEAARVKPLGV